MEKRMGSHLFWISLSAAMFPLALVAQVERMNRRAAAIKPGRVRFARIRQRLRSLRRPDDFRLHALTRHLPYAIAIVAGFLGLFQFVLSRLESMRLSSIWQAISLGIVFVVAGSMLYLILFSIKPSIALVRQVTSAEGLICPRCMYNLAGSPPSIGEVRCSECGRVSTASDLKQGWRDAACLPLNDKLGSKREGSDAGSSPDSGG
jgi:hypothetical protein